MRLDNWLAQRALTNPTRPAVVSDGESLGYADLELSAASAARRLAARGVRRGQRVAIAMPAGLDWVILLHAAMKLGAAVQPLGPGLTEHEQRERLDGVEQTHVLTDPGSLAGSQADVPLIGEHDMADPLAVVHTSGTSGRARPVELTYGNFLWSAVGSAFNLGVDPADRWLSCLPPSHIAGLSILVRSAIYGTEAIVHDGFDTDRVAACLERDGVTIVSLVATTLARLLEAGADLAAPRIVLVGGGPVPAEVLSEAAGRGATVVQTYGLTEACSQVTTLAPEDAARKLGSAGRQLLTTHLRIDDGEILVQGPTVAPACLDEDGWLRTGDAGRIDEEGFLWVEGRLDDLIVTGGENVAPPEVEEVLHRHPAVAEAAAVGRPDPEWQQAVTAVVVLRDGAVATEPELQAHCASSLASHKVPKRIEFAAELPRTASGKVERGALRVPPDR